MLKLGMEEDVPIESGLITKRSRPRRKLSKRRISIPANICLNTTNVMNKQRLAVYTLRRGLLEGVDQKEARDGNDARCSGRRGVEAACPQTCDPPNGI